MATFKGGYDYEFVNLADNQLCTMATGGYDYEFVNPPPNSLECSICLLTLCDPHVISCCGNHFCYTCISRIQGDRKPCPLCNEPNFTTLLHKGVKREVNALMIRCRWRHLGCDWEGELGQLEEHLHPGAGSRGKGCGYVIVECVYKCGDRFERRMIQDHELDACPRRPMEVQMSRLAKKFEASLGANEKKLNDVIAENEAIKAEIRAFHVENQTLKTENDQLKETVHQLKEKHDNMKRELDTHIFPTPIPPICFSIINCDHYRKVDYAWNSSSFYSHPGGYRLHCSVYPNGEGLAKGTHISFYLVFEKGEFDDHLKWPFNGVVTIEMFNWWDNKWDYSRTIPLDDSVPSKHRRRAGERLYGGVQGYSKWMSSEELAKKYRLHDVMRFKVTKIELK